MQNITKKHYIDSLTRLNNRLYFEQILPELNNKYIAPFSIITIDLNNLKKINDTYSYQKANFFLKMTAEIIKRFSREQDIKARIDGDQFVILMPEVSKREAEQVAKEIIDYFKSNDLPTRLTAGIGVATANRPQYSLYELFRLAEERMYRNKIARDVSHKYKVFSSLEKILEEKAGETRAHARRIEFLSVRLARQLGLSLNQIDELKIAARFHDIGKIIIDDSILNKPARLTNSEYEVVKTHAKIGYRIVKSIPVLAEVASLVLSHHERWDGKGYPGGLSRDEIPFLARIITIVDTYDVITHERPYKRAASIEFALREINNCAGSQFDPFLVREFIQLIQKLYDL